MNKSVHAYDAQGRVKKYDLEMDIMHPNRTKMIKVPLEFMPYETNAPLRALDLGTGTGLFTKLFLEKFPKAHVVALDGAATILEAAKARLGNLTSSVTFLVEDFKGLDKALSKNEKFDVIFSSFALHHLTPEEKIKMLQIVLNHLNPNGLFFNSDCLIAESPEVENRFQELRVEGIVERAEGSDSRFNDITKTRVLLDQLEAEENDMPLPLSEEIQIMKKAGFKNIDILWKEYREFVLYGCK